MPIARGVPEINHVTIFSAEGSGNMVNHTFAVNAHFELDRRRETWDHTRMRTRKQKVLASSGIQLYARHVWHRLNGRRLCLQCGLHVESREFGSARPLYFSVWFELDGKQHNVMPKCHGFNPLTHSAGG